MSWRRSARRRGIRRVDGAGGRDLNGRPTAYKAVALPIELRQHIILKSLRAGRSRLVSRYGAFATDTLNGVVDGMHGDHPSRVSIHAAAAQKL